MNNYNQDSEIILKNYLNSNHVPHALLFIGEDSNELIKSAKNFAASLMIQNGADDYSQKRVIDNSYPDCLVFSPDSKSSKYTIEQIRDICSQSQLYPQEAYKQFFILKSAHRMQDPAANALLKTLEEPTSSSVFILCVDSLDLVLPTIASRSQKVFFQNKSYDESMQSIVDLFASLLQNIEKLNYNNLFLSCEKIQKEIEKEAEKYKNDSLKQELFVSEQSKNLLIMTQKWFLENYLINQNIPQSLIEGMQINFQKVIDKTKLGLERSIKLSLCLENLVLNIKEQIETFEKLNAI